MTHRVDGADADHDKSFPFEYTEGGADDARRISIDVRNENGAWQCSRSFVVGDIISSNKCSVEAKKLSSGGVLIAHLTSATVTGSLKLQLSGKDLKNMDGMGLLRKSDPFFALMVLNDETGNWDAKYRSATVKNELDPEWEECSVDLVELCGGKFAFSVTCCGCDKGCVGSCSFLCLVGLGTALADRTSLSSHPCPSIRCR
mmetsp:Transcript_17664/g.35473  ORF Transcript_17664/g.35473 Transcript_17664/m.35473 type:complete len:201 (+) Transcript_17664:527-1129(+)